jgi:hypothetical protein
MLIQVPVFIFNYLLQIHLPFFYWLYKNFFVRTNCRKAWQPSDWNTISMCVKIFISCPRWTFIYICNRSYTCCTLCLIELNGETKVKYQKEGIDQSLPSIWPLSVIKLSSTSSTSEHCIKNIFWENLWFGVRVRQSFVLQNNHIPYLYFWKLTALSIQW